MDDPETQVIVIGAGIAGLAVAHRLHTRGIGVVLLESGDRAGGKIRTITEGGYQFEAGPNTLIANKPAMLDLLSEAGLNSEIIDGSPVAKKRWITFDGRMCPLPTNPVAALTSPLLGPGAVARALGDLFIGRPAATEEDETVTTFVERRFGKRVLENVVAPFLSGVYAGDPDHLEARAILPTLVEAEATNSSVIRGLITARRRARKSGAKRLPMRSITLRAGLEALPRRIAEILGDRLLLDSTVERLEEDNGRVEVTLVGGRTLRCRHVVVAGGTASAGLLCTLPGGDDLAARLASISHAGLSMVGLAIDRAAIAHPLDGFGYLHGHGAPGPVLGCLFRSSVFPHAAPAGKAFLVVFIGGVRFPGCAERPEADLIDLARADLDQTLGVRAVPEKTFVYRWRSAVPQYERGHSRLLASVQAWSRQRPVSVIGNLLTGASLNDCAAAGRNEADRLAALLDARPSIPENHACPSA